MPYTAAPSLLRHGLAEMASVFGKLNNVMGCIEASFFAL
jgi:hypothetical protein